MSRENHESLAIGSLVTGIASWIFAPVVGSIAAIVLGHLALQRLGKSYRGRSRSLAIVGLVLGYANVVVFVGLVFLFLAFAGLTAWGLSY